jgi:hypothetical protein
MYIRVAKIVCKRLQPISSELVLIPKYMVMSWTACTLSVASGQKPKASKCSEGIEFTLICKSHLNPSMTTQIEVELCWVTNF